MTEELITDLSYAKSLRVVSKASTIGFKKSHLSLPQIAEQLNVDAVIEGTVLQVNKTMPRITIRLTAAKPERQLWAASYERGVGDIVILQDQIAAEAVAQICNQLTPAGQTRLSLESQDQSRRIRRVSARPIPLRQESGEENNKAIPHLERANTTRPEFCCCTPPSVKLGVYRQPENYRETYAKGLEYSQEAVSLDPNSSEAYASLGHSLMQNHRWNEGEVALRRAIRLDAE